MVQYLLFLFVHNTLSICICHWVSKAQSRVRVCSSQGPFVAPRATSTVFLASYVQGAFPLENLPHSHLQSLSLLLADRTIFIGLLCLTGCKRNMSRFSTSLHCSSTSISRWPFQGNTWGYLLVNFNHLPNLMDIHMFCFNAPL